MNNWRKLLWLGSFAGLSTMFLLCLPATKSESKGTPKLTVLATASMDGETSPCG